MLAYLCDHVLAGDLTLGDALNQLCALGQSEQPDPRFVKGLAVMEMLGMAPLVGTADLGEIERRFYGFLDVGRIDAARVAAELGLAGARVIGDRRFQAYFAYQLAGVFGAVTGPAVRTDDLPADVRRRLDLCRFAVDVFRRDPSARFWLAMATVRLGGVYMDLMLWQEVARHSRQAVQLAEELDDKTPLAHACNNLGFALLNEAKRATKATWEWVTTCENSVTGDVHSAEIKRTSEGAHRRDLEEAFHTLERVGKLLADPPEAPNPLLQTLLQRGDSIKVTGSPTGFTEEVRIRIEGLLREAVTALRRARALHTQRKSPAEVRQTEGNLAQASFMLAELLLHGRC